MVINQCRKCKCHIEQGIYCNDCFEIIKQVRFEKYRNRIKSKQESSLTTLISKIKNVAEPRFWCTSHDQCFRASISEKSPHIDTCYMVWKLLRKMGFTVFCNLILSNGERPDITAVKKGVVPFHIEITHSEKIESIERKRTSYPFQVYVIKAQDCMIDNQVNDLILNLNIL